MLAQLASDTGSAPWWGVPLVAGAFTLIGVALSQLANLIVDTRRVTREDARRWATDLRQAAVRCSHVLLAIEQRTILSWGEGLARNEADDRIYHQRYEELLDVLAELDLIAPVIVSEAAHAVAEAATAAERESFRDQELFHQYVAARRKYTNAVRRHLGVELLPEPVYL